MSFEFLFKEDTEADKKCLQQGDILRRTEGLKAILSEAHTYYADAEDYHYFMVLTQSCDLVRRPKVKARYISLAAVRPLEVSVNRMLDKYGTRIDRFPLLVCDKQNEILMTQYLERLLHNTEPGKFFLKKDCHPAIKDNYCAFLDLSVAVRVNHYDVCLAAKVAQLAEIFQAKVGWLAGNLYSRIGTPDFEEHESNPQAIKQEFFDEILNKTVWVTPEQRRQLQDAIKKTPPQSTEDAKGLIAALEDDMQTLAKRIASRIALDVLKDKSKIEPITNLIASDRVVRRMLQAAATTNSN